MATNDASGGTYVARRRFLTRRKVFVSGGLMIILAVAFLAYVYPGDGVSTTDFSSLPTAAIVPLPLPDGKLSMPAFMLTGNNYSREEWRTAIRRMRSMGVQIPALGQVSWVDLEPEPGQYRWGYLETAMGVLEEEKSDMKVCADIAMFINPNLDGVPHLPKDLEGKPFDDAAVIERLSDLYLKFLDRFGPRVAYLFNHAAVLAEALGIYLGAISGTLWNPPIVRFMAANAGSSGLLTSDGRAKPAARVWCEAAAEYYRYRREADWLK